MSKFMDKIKDDMQCVMSALITGIVFSTCLMFACFGMILLAAWTLEIARKIMP